MTAQCCTGVGPSRRRARRLSGAAASILPGAALALLPKCPLCLAAWLTVATGIGISAAAVTRLRWLIVVVWVAAAVLAGARIVRGAKGRSIWRSPSKRARLNSMMKRLVLLALFSAAAYAQSFDVASIKLSAKPVGKDYNNQVAIGPSTFTAKNVTLQRLIVEAYSLVPPQVFGGPKWLDEAEYDVEAKADRAVSREELRRMLQPLLASRFHLVLHHETRELKAYELIADRGGPKIRPVKEGEGTPAPPGSRHFHGDLQQLANLISIQLTIPAATDDPSRPSYASAAPIPVFNRSGLAGLYDFDIEMKMEPGVPSFNLWQRVLQEQLGLKLESRKMPVDGLVVDSADRVPVAN